MKLVLNCYSNQYDKISDDEFSDDEFSDDEISGFANTTKFNTTKFLTTKFLTTKFQATKLPPPMQAESSMDPTGIQSTLARLPTSRCNKSPMNKTETEMKTLKINIASHEFHSKL